MIRIDGIELDSNGVNSAYLQSKFIKFLKRNKHDFSFENIFLFERESDIISFKNGFIYEYEFKVGESDFRKDIKKNRHSLSSPNYFCYVVSDESVVSGSCLCYAGIYVHKFSVDGCSSFRLIKQPELIRSNNVSWVELYTLLRKIYNNKKMIRLVEKSPTTVE